MEGTKEEVKETGVVKTSVYLPKGFSVGSRKATIKCIDKCIFLPNKNEFKEDVINKISSGWKKGTRDVVRGLSRNAIYVNEEGLEKIVNEEELYLTTVIGSTSTSEQWEARVKEYWADYSIPVSLVKGIELEIGFNPDGTPINLDGYISFNYASSKANVATTKDELDNKESEIFDYFIVDKYEEEQEKREKFLAMSKINRQYMKLIVSDNPQDKEKINYILEIMGGPEGTGMQLHTSIDDVNRQMLLEICKNKFSEKFSDLANDPNLATKALIRRAVFAGKISKEGQAFFMMDQRIGSSEKEAIGYLDNANNIGTREKLVSSIAEFSK